MSIIVIISMRIKLYKGIIGKGILKILKKKASDILGECYWED